MESHPVALDVRRGDRREPFRGVRAAAQRDRQSAEKGGHATEARCRERTLQGGRRAGSALEARKPTRFRERTASLQASHLPGATPRRAGLTMPHFSRVSATWSSVWLWQPCAGRAQRPAPRHSGRSGPGQKIQQRNGNVLSGRVPVAWGRRVQRCVATLGSTALEVPYAQSSPYESRDMSFLNALRNSGLKMV